MSKLNGFLNYKKIKAFFFKAYCYVWGNSFNSKKSLFIYINFYKKYKWYLFHNAAVLSTFYFFSNHFTEKFDNEPQGLLFGAVTAYMAWFFIIEYFTIFLYLFKKKGGGSTFEMYLRLVLITALVIFFTCAIWRIY